MSRRNGGIAYDERTGLRTEGRKLRQDWYTKVWTEDPDGPHPQDYVRPPGPDGVNHRHGPQEQSAIHTVERLDSVFDSKTMERRPIPRLGLGSIPHFISSGHDGIVYLMANASTLVSGGLR